MNKLVVTIAGLGFIGAIYWFFFGRKEEGVEVSKSLTVTVDGGYKPGIIKVKQGKSVTLTFIRKDANSCLEELYFPDYKIKEYLPMNTRVKVTLSPPHSGKSGFHCGMNMFHGRIEVVE